MFRSKSREGSRKTRWGSALMAGVLVVGMAQVIAVPAGAEVLGGRSIEVFFGSNLVSLTSYPADTEVKVQVLRKGVVIGSATKTTDAEGTIEMNHVGGTDCFDGPFSPDIQPRDKIRTSFGPAGSRTVDTSIVRGVWVDGIRFDIANKRIIVNGHVSLKGRAMVVPKVDVLELRINKDQPWDVNSRPGRRDRRVDIGRNVLANGTWRRVLKSSRADVRQAKASSETFLEWSAAAGETEAFPSELTVWDAGGEVIDCPPLR